MANISKITLPNGATYDIKDTVARNSISDIQDKMTTGMNYLGITTTTLADDATTSPITIDGKEVTPTAGDLVIFGGLEFIFNGTKWQELGDPTAKGLGDLAYKDNASASYKPAGTVSTPTFTGTASTLKDSITPAGTISTPTFTGTQKTISSSFTPAGTVNITTGTGTANYTPAGEVTAPTITITPQTASVTSITGVGTLPTCTLPALEASVADETLTLDWTAGSFSQGTLPTKGSAVSVLKSVSATATAPSFTGTGVKLNASFTGTEGTASATYTPTGTVSAPTFTGTATEVSIDYTPVGTVSQPTFTGTSATIKVS